MGEAFFGHTHLRNQVSAGVFPETSLCSGFLEMAKRVWRLHCLALSFEHEAEIFRVQKGCRFSEVYMKSVHGGSGVSVGNSLVQCEVYLSGS
ncbi:unnamed protein product [Brassica oleracea]